MWWWLRSPNYNNNNNFCNVNTSGGNNNNNAYYSAALLPGFYRYTVKWSSQEVKDDRCKRRDTSQGETLKLPSDGHARTLLAWRVIALISFHVLGQSSLEAHLQLNYAEGEYFL